MKGVPLSTRVQVRRAPDRNSIERRAAVQPPVAAKEEGRPPHDERPSMPGWVYPFTHTTCFSVCTTSTRSRCASITASMSL